MTTKASAISNMTAKIEAAKIQLYTSEIKGRTGFVVAYYGAIGVRYRDGKAEPAFDIVTVFEDLEDAKLAAELTTNGNGEHPEVMDHREYLRGIIRNIGQVLDELTK